MANQEQLNILMQGVASWNVWHENNPLVKIDLADAQLNGLVLTGIVLEGANLRQTRLVDTDLSRAILGFADLSQADLTKANLFLTNFQSAILARTNLTNAHMAYTIFGNTGIDNAIGLETIRHEAASSIDVLTLRRVRGNIPEIFLRGCGLSDWEIESSKLYNPNLSNDEFIDIQNKIFDLHNRQALQISPLFISYSHDDNAFVDKLENHLNKKSIRFWRDIHDLKSGRIEAQIDRAIRQNPTVLLVLSEHSLQSDWVEHEVRTARQLEKEMSREVLCPIAMDNSWKNGPWPKRVMEQVTEYNILDFSEWQDDVKFERTFQKLIDGLELFYKG